MLAKRLPTIMPAMDLEESLEITRLYSICGLLPEEDSVITRRPFRAPHHTITQTALTGGGRIPMPGEITLAAKGVLFLDELPEFSRSSLEVLRQPLEEHKVTVSRLGKSYEYPSDCIFVAAMNPCRCGYFPDRKRCRCTTGEIQRYLGKISEPLLAEGTSAPHKSAGGWKRRFVYRRNATGKSRFLIMGSCRNSCCTNTVRWEKRSRNI